MLRRGGGIGGVKNEERRMKNSNDYGGDLGLNLGMGIQILIMKIHQKMMLNKLRKRFKTM